MRDKRSVKLPRLGKYVLELELEFRDDVRRLGRDALAAGLARVTLATPAPPSTSNIGFHPNKRRKPDQKSGSCARDEGVLCQGIRN